MIVGTEIAVLLQENIRVETRSKRLCSLPDVPALAVTPRRPQVASQKPTAVAGDQGFGLRLRLTTAPYLSRAYCTAYHFALPGRGPNAAIVEFLLDGVV
jgi:hypothetical protein